MKKLALAISLAAATTAAYGSGDTPSQVSGETDIGHTPYYAQTGWASVHRDSSNSDYSPFVAPAENKVDWAVLDGAATLLAASYGPEGNRYVTTGRGPGYSHLHAFDRDGNLLWESAPQNSKADLDSAAIVSATLVDNDGIVYTADYDQFWAFTPDGTVKWVADLPTPGQPFVSAILTNEGYVGGITTAGEVVLLNREDGSAAVPVYQLPIGEAPPAAPPRPGLWKGGLMDPTIIPLVEAAFFGEVMQVANSPAVHPKTGRIYITAAGPLEMGELTGRLYALDIVDGELQLAFGAPMGGGSGTSPAISPDGSAVYAADSNGVMTAFDAYTGEVIWEATGAAGAASPGVGPDGTIYSGDSKSATETVVALNPEDGSTLWANNYDELANTLMDPLPPYPPFFTGTPTARFNSVISISAEKIWVVLAAGYNFYNPSSNRYSMQPRATLLVSLDPKDGSVIGYTELRDTNEGLISIGSDGTLTASQGSINTSIHYYGINPLLNYYIAYYGMPAEYRFPISPIGGLTQVGPVSFLNHAVEGIEWVGSLNATALAELPGGDLEAAFTATRRAHTQLTATIGTVAEALEAGEIDAETASSVSLKLTDTAAQIVDARNKLDKAAPSSNEQNKAIKSLESADKQLEKSLALLAR